MDLADGVVVVHSGGLDSTVLLTDCIRTWGKDNIVALNFDYGSKHNERERRAAREICDALDVRQVQINLPFVGNLFRSDLLHSGGEIPEGHYADESMKRTVVPFRNGIMLSIAVGYAESIGADLVGIANHGGDHFIYPDCRASFIQNFNKAVLEGTEKKVKIYAPYTGLMKQDIVSIGVRVGAPLHLSYSCYKGREVHCGLCGTCIERKEAFQLEGVEDPTVYEA